MTHDLETDPMDTPRPAEPKCPITECRALVSVIDAVANKWTIMTVGVLTKRPMRFNEIKRGIPGLSSRMLALTLQAMQRDGLVARAAGCTGGRADYELTLLGCSLSRPLGDIMDWAGTWRNHLEDARKTYDALVQSRCD